MSRKRTDDNWSNICRNCPPKSEADLEETSSTESSELRNGKKLNRDYAKNGKLMAVNGGFKDKEFCLRESLLTDLFQSSDIAVIYNFFLAILILLMTNTLVKDALEQGRLNLNLWIIWWNFGKFPWVLGVWLLMFASTCYIVYPIFNYWAHKPRLNISFKSETWWICAYLGYIFAMFYFPLKFLFDFDLPISSSFIITCENVRILMKVHAFIRENVPRALKYKTAVAKLEQRKPGQNVPKSEFPVLAKWVFYFFCPSFIYRDQYPRTEKCDWVKVFKYFLQCLGCIVYTGYIFTRFCIPIFEEVDYKSVGYPKMILSIFPSILPGAFCLILLFWGILHCWLNMFSEFMRFGDRLFYLDWWNSTSMATYYRNWNLVVHEWLYTYVYKDISQAVGDKRGRKVAQISVFFLSAAVHEYWFGIGFRIFYPVMFLLYFFLGGSFFFISRLIKMDQVWNVLMWVNLLIGNGMFVALYSMEWYARQRCAPSFESELLDFLVPRSWLCK